jgi:putative cardiolipin synthase
MRALLAVTIIALAGCSALPRGAQVAKPESFALQNPEDTSLGQRFIPMSRQHDGESGYHLINSGVDGFLVRMQLIRGAERTIDMQYFIFRGDPPGLMIAGELERAADRGVRVRILVDDGDTVVGDENILALGTHRNIEVRVFNPFDYRGHNRLLRHLDFLVHKGRLDYRMHNKLMVVDGAVALIGGRNIGGQYFQVDPDSQFADDDAFAAGAIAGKLSKNFDGYWNSEFAVPSAALPLPTLRPPNSRASFADAGIDIQARVESGQPLQSLITSEGALEWADARIVCDSPDKQGVQQRRKRGRLMAPEVTAAMADSRSELLVVTPYFVPSPTEIELLETLRQRQAAVRILSNSLESAPELAAQAGYNNYRKQLLEDGAQLYEVRALLDSTRGSGQTHRISRYGTYGLHAKLYVMDRRRLYIGSMNYDQRSWHLNTETGLIIDDQVLAQQMAARFASMVTPEAAYEVRLRPNATGGDALEWRTEIDHRQAALDHEPSRGFWQRLKVRFLSLLPIEHEL